MQRSFEARDGKRDAQGIQSGRWCEAARLVEALCDGKVYDCA